MTESSPYAGRWVALVGEQVVGVGRTADEAFHFAHHSRPKERFSIRYEESAGENLLPLSDLLDDIRPILHTTSKPVYLVGGAVRDALLQRISYDLDFVVPNEAVKLAFHVADALKAPAYVLDQERDTGRVVLADRQTMLDFARFRGDSLEADLKGRDFTINALALPAVARYAHSVIDFTGGLKDLQQGKIRIIHPLSIEDDPVRSLRALRLAASLGFQLTAETEAAVVAAVPDLNKISMERQRDELLKILKTARPGDVLKHMEALTLLAAVLPEIAQLSVVQQSDPHFENVLDHSARVLQWWVKIENLLFHEKYNNEAVLDDVHDVLGKYISRLGEHFNRTVDGEIDGWLIIRLGALFHDSGKRETQKVEEDGRIRFFGHEAAGAELAGKRLRQLCLSKKAIKQVKCIVTGHMRPLSLVQAQGSRPSRRAVYRYFQATAENGLDIGLLALADHLATYDGPGEGETWQELLGLVANLFQYYFDKPQQAVKPPPLVNGRDLIELLGMQPGPEIGRILRLISENQAAGEINSREEALLFAREQVL